MNQLAAMGTSTTISAEEAEFLEAEHRVLDRYGVEAERWTVDVDAVGGRASGLVAGSGAPVLMVVGGGPPMGIWIPVIAELLDFRLYAVDLPGLGLTSPITLDTGNHRSTAVAFLGGVMDALGIDAAPVAAQSIGGLWAFWFAIDRPDRVNAISCLSCPATILGASAPLPLRLMTVPVIGPLLQRLDPPAPKQVDRFIHLAGERFADQDELRRLFLAVERLPTYGPSLRNLVRATVRLRGAQPDVELTEEQLCGVSLPVQLLWGDHDPFGPPEIGQRARDLIPDAELHVVPGGHGFWVDRPKEVAGHMAPFLASSWDVRPC